MMIMYHGSHLHLSSLSRLKPVSLHRHNLWREPHLTEIMIILTIIILISITITVTITITITITIFIT